MLIEGTETIQASRQKTWEFLTNPDSVSQCVPGLKSVQVVEPDKKFKAVASVGFGAVSATFANDVEFMELHAPDKAIVKVHGTAPGSAVDVMAEMVMSDHPDGGTQMAWKADITISGSIASLATRMMGGVSKKLTSNFFTCVKGKLEG